MKNPLLYGTLAALLLTGAACSTAPAPANTSANKPANTNTAVANTNTATTTNTANTATTNTANTATTNTNSSATNTATGGAQDFKLINDTGVAINAVYITPHDAEDWEEDILGQDNLPNGQSVDVKFNREETAANWDLRVEAKDGSSIEWENLNLLEINELTLNYKDGKATAIKK